MAISKVIIIWAAPCISYQLGNINTIWRARWDIARKEWKIDNVEIKIITFVIELGVKSIVALYNEWQTLQQVIARKNVQKAKFEAAEMIIDPWIQQKVIVDDPWSIFCCSEPVSINNPIVKMSYWFPGCSEMTLRQKLSSILATVNWLTSKNKLLTKSWTGVKE